MKKLSAILLVICSSFIFTGCPYESPVPIDQPSEKLSRYLLGTWTTKSTEMPSTFIVSRDDNFNYRIEQIGEKASIIYTAFLSKVDEELFLNITDVSDPNKSYSFAKVELNYQAPKFTLHFISDALKKKFNSSEELKSFIRENKADSKLYEPKLEFEKTGS
jgi:hypothetical protein